MRKCDTKSSIYFSNFIILVPFQCGEKLSCALFININYYYNKLYMRVSDIVMDK